MCGAPISTNKATQLRVVPRTRFTCVKRRNNFLSYPTDSRLASQSEHLLLGIWKTLWKPRQVSNR